MLRAAARQQAQWARDGLGHLFIAVNASAHQFKRNVLVDQVRAALAEHGAEARRLQIELTEHTLIEDVAANVQTLASLRLLGIKIAIDDFGTGLSSLAYLKRLPIDKLKIDRSFVNDLTADNEDTAIVARGDLEPRVLGAQPRQFHLLGRHRLRTGRVELTARSRLDPVAQRLRNQTQFARCHAYAHLSGAHDGLFLEFSRVLPLRNSSALFILPVSMLTIDRWKTKSDGQLILVHALEAIPDSEEHGNHGHAAKNPRIGKKVDVHARTI